MILLGFAAGFNGYLASLATKGFTEQDIGPALVSVADFRQLLQ
jgi:hypothetical protein